MVAVSGGEAAAMAEVLDDQARLAHAGGDATLAAELLELFRRHVLPEAEGLVAQEHGAARRALAHKVRGAALAIGARELAGAALAIEQDDGLSDEHRSAFVAALGRLGAALAETSDRGRGG